HCSTPREALMRRRLLLCANLLFASRSVLAQATCDLAMSVVCQTGTNGAPSACTATTINNGSTACAGLIYSAWFSQESPETVHLSVPQNSLQLDTCLDSDQFGDLVGEAISFCFGEGSLGA